MFRIGQKIICINNLPDPTRKLPDGFKTLVKDKIYTIRDIYEIKGVIGILLNEVINDIHPKSKQEIGYSIDRFRPLIDNGLLSDLLSNIVDERLDIKIHQVEPEEELCS